MTKTKVDMLAEALKANYKRVTVWNYVNVPNKFSVECKGFSGPSKKVEKIIKDCGFEIIESFWSEGSDYTGYYYKIQ